MLLDPPFFILGLDNKERSVFTFMDTGNGFIFLAFVFLLFAIILVVATDGKNLNTQAPIEEKGVRVVRDVGVSDFDPVTLGDVVDTRDGDKALRESSEKDPNGKSQVVKQKSDVDNDYYYVAADLPDKKKAANKLAEVHRRSQYLLQSIDEQLDGNRRIITEDGTDITDNMRRLVNRHYQKKIPFAEYNNPNPDDYTVGSNSEKGELIEMCLRSKFNSNEWNSDNTLFKVHVHELAHSADFDYRQDHHHGPEFDRLNNYLLKIAQNLGIYSCSDYMKSGKKFCGLKLEEECKL